MGLSLITAAIIQTRGDDVKAEVWGEKGTGRFVPVIVLYNRERPRILVSFENQPMKSESAALLAGRVFIKEIRDGEQVDPFAGIVDPEDRAIIGLIVEAARQERPQ